MGKRLQIKSLLARLFIFIKKNLRRFFNFGKNSVTLYKNLFGFSMQLDYLKQDLANYISLSELNLKATLISEIKKPDFENPQEKYQIALPEKYEVYLDKLKQLEPEIFPTWMQLFENGKKSYYELTEASCSNEKNPYSLAFGSFINLHAKGRILDLGCGPFGLPTYLKNFPLEKISAIEPLPMEKKVDFEVVQGFAEFLPWPDSSFSAVISATSFDHVLSLETSINEIHRVLTPNGCFILWIASIAHSTHFDPKKRPVVAVDQYHLFHFDAVWLEPMLENRFILKDKLVYPTSSFDHIFYCLYPKSNFI